MPALLNSAARVSLTSTPDDYKAPWQQPHSAADRLPGSQGGVAQSTAPCAELLSTRNADVALAHAQFPSLRYRCASNPQHLDSVSRVTNLCGLHSFMRGLQYSHERTPTKILAPCRPLCPGDEDELQRLHAALFPINYEMVFFQKAVRGHDNIFSWAALQTCAICWGH